MEYELNDLLISIRIKQYENSLRVIYRPTHVDTLFWCYYIMQYGHLKYNIDSYNYEFVTTTTEKFRAIELLHKSKAILKEYKLHLSTLEGILSNTTNILDINTFFAVCLCANINVIYIHKNTCYYEVMPNQENTSTIHVIKLENKSYTCELNVVKSKLDIAKLLKVDIHHGMANPLYPLSKYKVSDLRDICEKMDIAIPSAKTPKADIYDLILSFAKKN
jgi:hypothetical protein